MKLAPRHSVLPIIFERLSLAVVADAFDTMTVEAQPLPEDPNEATAAACESALRGDGGILLDEGFPVGFISVSKRPFLNSYFGGPVPSVVFSYSVGRYIQRGREPGRRCLAMMLDLRAYCRTYEGLWRILPEQWQTSEVRDYLRPACCIFEEQGDWVRLHRSHTPDELPPPWEGIPWERVEVEEWATMWREVTAEAFAT